MKNPPILRVVGLTTLLAFAPAILAGQRGIGSGRAARVDYYFYHGSTAVQGSSRIEFGDKRFRFAGQRHVELRRPPGTKVCVTIPDANPANYIYGLGVTVDTTQPKLPDLGPFAVLAAGFEAKTAVEAAQKSLPATQWLDPVRDYVRTLKTLELEIDTARVWARESDIPESIDDLGLPVQKRTAGYSRAKRLLDTLSTAKGHFNSRTLEADLDSLGKAAEVAAGPDGDRALVVRAFRGYGKLMLQARDALRDSFKSSPELAVCGEVGSGVTTLSLSIVPRAGGYGDSRDHGDAIDFELVVAPPYSRSTVEVVPIAFVAFASNVPQFEIVGDTLRGPRDDATAFRVGALLQINVASFGASDELGVGVGIGLGSRGSDKLVSDVFVGPVLSYRDVIRIGLGVGGSQFPASVKKATVDHPFPSDAGMLEDLIEQRMRRAYQVIVLFPGIKF